MFNLLVGLFSLFFSFSPQVPTMQPIMTNTVVIEEDENTISNDTLEYATNISSNNYYDGVDWETNIYGILEGSNYSSDIDLYYFNIMSNYNIEIILNIESTVNSIDFSIVYIQYYNHATHKDEQGNPTFVSAQKNYETIYSNTSRNVNNCEHSKRYSGILNPGTYVIILDRQQDESIISDINYSINCNFENGTCLDSEYIPDLIHNKQLGGAVWIADFIPCDALNYIGNNTPIYYYCKNDQSANINDHLLNNIYHDLNDTKILAAMYYIWDSEIIEGLHDALYGWYQDVLINIGECEKIKISVDAKLDNLKTSIIISTTISKIIDNVPINSTFTKTVQFALKGYAKVIAPILECIIKSKIPDNYDDLIVYEDALQTLLAVMDAWGDGVLCIPIYYRIVVDGNPSFPNTLKYYVSYQVTNEVISDSIDFTYDELYLYNIIEDEITYTGKIYGLTNISTENEDLMLASEYNDVMRNATIMSSLENVEPLELGNYDWLLFESSDVDTYYFVFKSTSEHEIHIFNSIVAGYSEDGLICKYFSEHREEIYEEDSTTGMDVFVGYYYITYIIIKATANGSYYFRISGNNYDPMNSLSVMISNQPCEYEHSHSYLKYTWINDSQHFATCICGHVQIQGHSRLPNSVYCLLCKGTCQNGFLPAPLTRKEESEV